MVDLDVSRNVALSAHDVSSTVTGVPGAEDLGRAEQTAGLLRVAATAYCDGLVHIEVAPPPSPPPKEECASSPAALEQKSSSFATPETHLVFVVDVSGSMGQEAEITSESGDKERHGFSVLNLVQHAAVTTIRSLNASQRVSLVTFTSQATTVFQRVVMDEDGQRRSEAEVRALKPQNATNLWAGLHEALEIVRKEDSSCSRTEILLFTDGVPNREPPNGHIAALQEYLTRYPDVSCTIRTFGFGFNLKSDLLVDIAKHGPSPGSFSYIPDPSMLGTVFIHAIADILATFPAVNVNVTLDCSDVAVDDVEIKLGTIAYGQPRSFALRIPSNEGQGVSKARAALLYTYVLGNGGPQRLECSAPVEPGREASPEALATELRLELCVVLKIGLAQANANQLIEAQRTLNEFESKLTPLASRHPTIQALLEDVQGQIKEAFSRRDWYIRWGVHYLRSLLNSHLLQKRNNFKDPGVQCYGGAHFGELVEHVSDVFDCVSPPEPTAMHSSCSAQARSRVTSMSTYNCSGNVCFAAGCSVLMADGVAKPVELLVKGDHVLTPDGKSSGVLCVVKTCCHEEHAALVQLPGGPLITPWHPVRWNGEWSFPVEVAPKEMYPCPAVYNVVLEHGHQIIVNGVVAVTLGHQLQGPKVGHAFFGTDAVRQDLQGMAGYSSGLVVLEERSCLVRDSLTGLVVGFCQTTNTNTDCQTNCAHEAVAMVLSAGFDRALLPVQ